MEDYPVPRDSSSTFHVATMRDISTNWHLFIYCSTFVEK